MQLIPKPAPGFDDPLGLLSACHERILSHCATLERLVPHLRQYGADEDAQQAAARILRYFQVAAPLHHQDEECDLFPALRFHDDFPDMLHAVLENLAAQHGELDSIWMPLEGALQAVAKGLPADLAIQDFVALTRAHIAVEEQEIFPLATCYLGAETLAKLSHAMQERRQTQSY
ncbi:MAG: hemerythrin domain-containing protein [Sulfuriferula sp.]|jgi:hemerythrin-like domain-containing protein